MDIGNWVLETADGERETIAEGTTLYPFAYYIYAPPYQWLDNSEEAITLRDTKGGERDKTPLVSDTENDNRYWMRNNSTWTFGVKELEKGEIWGGVVKHIVDGDTIDVSFGITGIQRIRLVGVNTPEIGEEGYEEAKEFVNKTCLWEEVKFDVDDKEQYDPYYRILAVVYVNDTNLNEKLVREGYAEIMYIPPSEFNPYEWKVDNPSNQKVKLKVSDVKYSQGGFNETCSGIEISVSMTVSNPYNFPVERIAVECAGIYPGLPGGRGLIPIPCNVPNRLGAKESVVVNCYNCGIKPVVDVEVTVTGWKESPTPIALTPTPSPTYTPSPSPTSIPGFDFLFAIIGILAAIYLIRRRG